MARKRERAKDRKQKQRGEAPSGGLDHASGEVDRVEAAIVAGAGGQPYEGDLEADEALDDDELGAGAGDVATPPAARQAALPRLFTFFRACWAELQRVQWPDRRQVGQATAVVLGFVAIAGAFLGAADFVAQKLFELIL